MDKLSLTQRKQTTYKWNWKNTPKPKLNLKKTWSKTNSQL